MNDARSCAREHGPPLPPAIRGAAARPVRQHLAAVRGPNENVRVESLERGVSAMIHFPQGIGTTWNGP
ncbi:MAG: hypothetical protein OXP68_02595 [Anaerolineaceae bacterium]|nr:hypothetical protein [Anaerolineaceae bacterium]MDE0328104.1 hypothetical protein [Anaerolineaceae bacterium]